MSSVARAVFQRVGERGKRARMPNCATEGGSGYDIYTCDKITIPAMQMRKIDLGFALQFSKNIVGLIKDRSGMAMKGLHIHAGVLDSDYWGEVGALAMNVTDKDITLEAGTRFAQIVFCALVRPTIKEGTVSITERNPHGFESSTGTK